jgi:hypothetical protein
MDTVLRMEGRLKLGSEPREGTSYLGGIPGVGSGNLEAKCC